MKLSIIGGGYVGLVTGTCFAELGHEVTIIEIDPVKVQSINNGRPPIYEAGLKELLRKNTGSRLIASTSYESVSLAEIVVIAVGTPPHPDGSADLSYIESASRLLGNELKNNSSYCVIIVKSTVPPGTTEKIVKPSVLLASGKSEAEIGFAMNPEFLREGRAVEDFLHPDRIVIGSSDPEAGNRAAEIYKDVQAPIIRTGISAAEMIKYTSNAFLATKISFSNEIGNICKSLGIDVYEVMRGVGLDARIGPLFLNAGAGFGGSCFPKDVSALVSLAKETGERPALLESVLAVNEQQPHRMIVLLEEQLGNISGKRIAVLGLAFKDNTDDIRDSRAIPVIQELVSRGACVVAYDPMAIPNMQKVFPDIAYCSSAAEALNGADACLVMTEWSEFSRLDKEFDQMAHKIIIEGRRILSRRGVVGICW
jgi:UDPglucose 6-dehydrogenase